MALRFLRSMRLTRRRDFARVYREGARARGPILTVVAAPNGLAVTRLGLSVGRVVSRRAVDRNRVRRILREAFRLEYPGLPRGFDLVLIPTRGAASPQLAETRVELPRLAERAVDKLRRRGAQAAQEGGAP